jgi:calcineurin-like phosphoesterase family protein
VFCPLPENQKLTVQGRRPGVPSGVRIYAIGDIHGRVDLLDDLLARIDTDIAARPIITPVHVFLGDYIDRGPSSRETVSRLIEHSETSHSIFLKGNHELLLLRCLADISSFNQWIRVGGLQTMMSYDVAADAMRGDVAKLQIALHDRVPQSHLHFFRDLQLSFTCGDFFFVHAGVKPTVELSRQTEHDMLWIREEFLSFGGDFGKIIVHGHTRAHQAEAQPNRVNIDTGAFATDCLTCLVIQNEITSIINTT